MKDNMQNIADLIGALAEDIEEIKKTLTSKETTDKDGALKRLAVSLEPIVRFFNGGTFGNINDIFKSKESISAYKKALGNEVIASLQEYTETNEKNMREHGVPTTRELLYKILEKLTDHVEKDKRDLEKAQQKQGYISRLMQAIRLNKALRKTRLLWRKVPDGWYKNPYAWTGIFITFLFTALFVVSWVQWHEYREENIRLRTVADKYQVATTILNGLYPELGVTVSAYEKLVETAGVDSTLAVFRHQMEKVRNENNKSKQQSE